MKNLTKDEFLRLKKALEMTDVHVSDPILIRVLAVYEVIKEKGDLFSIMDASNISSMKLP